MSNPKIDPRLRARRAAVYRAEGRRRLNLLLAALAIIGTFFCGWAALRSSLLDLDHIEITGVTGARLTEVQQVSPLEIGAPLKDINTRVFQNKLEELPWVESAEVEKSWPNKVKIDVTERIAVAQVERSYGKVAIVDGSGVVMAEGSAGYLHDLKLPSIKTALRANLGETEPHALPGLALIEAMPEDLSAWVDAVTYTPNDTPTARGTISIDLIGSAAAHLGEPILLNDKIQALRSVLNGVELTCIRTIDVAVPDFPTVRRDPNCKAAAGLK